jgi:hypothetical protein
MKRIMIYFIGPFLYLLFSMFTLVSQVNIGFDGVYNCAMFGNLECSWFDYIFRSWITTSLILGVLFWFIVSYLVAKFVFYLINLYKSKKIKKFYIYISILVIFIIIIFSLYNRGGL